jgi:hypothetical protein
MENAYLLSLSLSLSLSVVFWDRDGLAEMGEVGQYKLASLGFGPKSRVNL